MSTNSNNNNKVAPSAGAEGNFNDKERINASVVEFTLGETETPAQPPAVFSIDNNNLSLRHV